MNTNLIMKSRTRHRAKTLLLYSLTPLLLLLPLSVQAKLNVVATLPDFGSLARELGGDKIDLVGLLQDIRSHPELDVTELRSKHARISMSTYIRLPQCVALLYSPLRRRHRCLSRTEARHSAFNDTFDRCHPKNERVPHQSDHRETVS